jgi:SH3-like domain-containing protein
MSRPESTAVVIKAWAASYPYSVRLVSGEPVSILKRDPECPGWLWCRASDGKEAWIPEAFVEPMGEFMSGASSDDSGRGRMRRDYDSTELSVAEGERLFLIEAESGWVWAEDSSGRRGWIPTICLG